MLLDNSEVATAASDDPVNLHAAFCELVSVMRESNNHLIVLYSIQG